MQDDIKGNCWGGGGYIGPMSYLLNFSVNTKLFYKIN